VECLSYCASHADAIQWPVAAVNEGREKSMKNLLATLLIAVPISAAVAAEEFYVVQNPDTKNCKISNKKDDGKNVMIGTSSYPSAEEAKKAKNAAPECKEEAKK
jgi:hypothetical protein